MKPHFMPRNPGANPWEPSGVRGIPIASALTFSSKSPFLYDDWERGVARPYQLVLMPGYVPSTAPSVLADADYAWFDRPVDRPTIVWDGFCPVALWEVAYCAFKQPVVGGKVQVRNALLKSWVSDNRSASLLATRPQESPDLPDPVENPYAYGMRKRQYRKALLSWAHDCSLLEKGGYKAQADWRLTAAMYTAILAPRTEWHVDSARRNVMAEAKWNRNHLVPIVERSGYQSPVRFMDRDMCQRAHQAFAQEAAAKQVEAAARTRAFTPRPALEGPRDGLWSRFFGRG